MYEDLREDLFGDTGKEIMCGSILVIDDYGIPFNLLNVSFEVSRPIRVNITLEYLNASAQEIKVSKCQGKMCTDKDSGL